MTKKQFQHNLEESIAKAWLCRVGFHDQLLTEIEATTLNQIVHRTPAAKLFVRLDDLFEQDPMDADKIERTIESLELLGLHVNDNLVLELAEGSPLDDQISKMVVSSHLPRLAAYIPMYSAPLVSSSKEATAN
jgi:hypothetical protein